MKTQWILTALVGLCLLTVNGQAAATFPLLPDETKVIIRSTATEGQSMHVLLANLQQRFTRVELTTERGTLLVAKTIDNHTGYSVAFDLSRLKDGRYLLKVNQGKTTLTQVVLIQDGNILFSAVK